jgi:hypothetical protein
MHGLKVGVDVGVRVGVPVRVGGDVRVGVGVAVGTAQNPSTHTCPSGQTPSGQLPGPKNGLMFTNTSAAVLPSLGLRLDANDTNPMRMPSPLTEGGMSGVPLFA